MAPKPPDFQNCRYIDFWTLTKRALDFALARMPSVDKAIKPKLLEAYLTLDAYPDARTTLHALKARGERMAILSNGSPRMLAAAVEAAQIGAHLDTILSVDQIQVYKPRKEVYSMVTEALPVKPADVLFVSSNWWDVMGATAFGFRSIWVNRGKFPDEYLDDPPLMTVPDLRGLPSFVP